MARRIQIQLIACCLLLSGIAVAQPNSSSILVSYSFDDNMLETGPDTFAVFQKAQGSVTLSTENHWSGYRSVELRDVAGDGDFPELQGYFPQRTSGKLFLHFAIMTADPTEELNIALAGPEWFALRKNGIGFWLKTGEGYLYQVSDSMPKKLLMLRPFVWYVVNVAFDIDTGTYDLTIHAEGQEKPVTVLQGQANAPNQQASAVDKFSFIGDPGSDHSNVVYYVDDVLVGVDESIIQLPFAAPGRRKLFMDYWIEYQRDRSGQPGPLSAMSLSDFGIGAREVESLRSAKLWDVLLEVFAGKQPKIPETASSENRRFLDAVRSWVDGYTALNNGDAAAALARFEHARDLVPAGKIYQMNAVISMARLGRWDNVDRSLSEIISQWRDDLRLPVALAGIGLARRDFNDAERWLRTPAEKAADPSPQPNAVSEEIVAEQYFFVLLWKNDVSQAERFAERMANRGGQPVVTRSLWLERMGDAAFFSGNLPQALLRYEESFNGHDASSSVLLKLSDVHFRMGNPDKERMYREMVYGTLQRHRSN